MGDVMLDVYVITSYEQAKVISHKLRLQIMTIFKDHNPRTAKQIADELELPASKVHYHVRELERAGIVEIVETREKGGVIEKYYLPIAKEFRIHLSDEENEREGKESASSKLTKVLFNDYRDSFITATFESEKPENRDKDELRPYLTIRNLYLTTDQYKELHDEIMAVLERWKATYEQNSAHSGEMRQTYKMLLSIHPFDQKKSIKGNAVID
jgi:DNA-binding transcriptional ArsR family regulator